MLTSFTTQMHYRKLSVEARAVIEAVDLKNGDGCYFGLDLVSTANNDDSFSEHEEMIISESTE
ncbi:hypothetical protein Tco_1305332, partial [Tanacetum coccineum]